MITREQFESARQLCKSYIDQERQKLIELEHTYIAHSTPLNEVRMHQLDISVRSFNCLCVFMTHYCGGAFRMVHKGDVSIVEVYPYLSKQKLSEVRNCGGQSIEEITKAFKTFGLDIKD